MTDGNTEAQFAAGLPVANMRANGLIDSFGLKEDIRGIVVAAKRGGVGFEFLIDFLMLERGFEAVYERALIMSQRGLSALPDRVEPATFTVEVLPPDLSGLMRLVTEADRVINDYSSAPKEATTLKAEDTTWARRMPPKS
jgi:hypothetical protein